MTEQRKRPVSGPQARPETGPATERDPEPRVALVTGAARGIGAATVAALVAGGWRSWPSTSAPTTRPCPTHSVTVTTWRRSRRRAAVATFEADTRDVSVLAKAVMATERTFGGLDAALAIAGVIAGGVPAWEMPADQEQAVLDIDLGGVLNLARVAVPAMLRRPSRGTGVSSPSPPSPRPAGCPCWPATARPRPGWPVSCALSPRSCGAPGSRRTRSAPVPRRRASWTRAPAVRAASARSFAPQQAHERLLDADEVAAVLPFLAGDGASGMTGAIVPVDGGMAI